MATVLPPPVGNAELATTQPVTEQLTEIASDVASDAGTLLEKHFALLGSELKVGVQDAKLGGGLLAVGTGWVVFGGAFLLVGLVKLLGWAVPTLPEFACWLIGGGVLFALGVGLAYAGSRMLTGIDLVPHRTLHNIQETWSWIVNRRT